LTYADIDANAPAAIRSVDELVSYVTDFLSARFHDLFHRITMHHKMSPSTFKSTVRDIVSSTKKLLPATTPSSIKIVAFVDEFNATSIMGLLKEVFVDHTMDGDEIPSNILWVGAMNPFEVLKEDQNRKTLDFTGIATTDLKFIVRPPPPSMEELIFDFKKFTPTQEQAFLTVLLMNRYDTGSGKYPLEDEERSSILSFVLYSQDFVRSAKMDRVSLSIRDIHIPLRHASVYASIIFPHLSPLSSFLIISLDVAFFTPLVCDFPPYFALFCFILLYFALFCFILLYFALFCFILLYFALFCFILLYFAYCLMREIVNGAALIMNSL
jgi:hypothetical protein